MIQVDSTKIVEIRKKFPHLHIRRTANKYYLEERPEVIAYLKRCGTNKE